MYLGLPYVSEDVSCPVKSYSHIYGSIDRLNAIHPIIILIYSLLHFFSFSFEYNR
jgi:hypothetical protein